MPPFYAYSGHRGMRRVLLDLKADAGREAFLRLAEHADVVIESFRPGVVDRLGIGYDGVDAVQPQASSTARPAATARPARARSGPATTSTTSPSAATSTAPSAPPAASPPIPGATVADTRRRRHARGDGDPGGARRARARPARAPTSTSRSPTACCRSCRSTSTSTWPPATVPGPGHNILTGRYACYDIYGCARRPVAGGRRDRAALLRQPLPRARPASSGSTHQTDDEVQDEIRADFARGVRHPRPGRVGRRARPRPTPASPPSTPCPSWSTTRTSRPEVRSPRPGTRPTAASARSAPVLAGQDARRRRSRSRTGRSPTPTSCSPRPASRRRDRRAAHRRSRRMTSDVTEADLPPDVAALIGVAQYEEAGEFPVERGYIWTSALVGRERQPAVLGRRGRRRAHRWADRAAHDARRSGSVPTTGPRAAPSRLCRSRSTST